MLPPVKLQPMCTTGTLRQLTVDNQEQAQARAKIVESQRAVTSDQDYLLSDLVSQQLWGYQILSQVLSCHTLLLEQSGFTVA